MTRNSFRLNFLVAALIATTGNAIGQTAETNSAPMASERDIDIGGRTLHLATYGSGSPTVVIESGMGEPAVESGSWKDVIAGVSKITTVCVYDRAGLGKSGAVTNATRTTADVVQDLHTMLVNAKIAPPYILVGHSIGGFTVRLYAGRFSKEVAGAVLVDSSYPDQWSKLIGIFPPETAAEPESIKRMRGFLIGYILAPQTILNVWICLRAAAKFLLSPIWANFRWLF